MARSKLNRIVKDRRVIILAICVVIALIAINPNPWREEAVIKAVDKGSAAETAGLRPEQRIISIDGQQVKNIEDVTRLTSNLKINDTITIETKNAFYKVKAKPKSNESNEAEGIGIIAANAPKTKIKTGLDLRGGIRILLKPETKISKTDLELIKENINRRVNIYGLSDVVVRDASDISGNQYIMVEIAGITEKEVREFVSKQGKFEAKVGNTSVFKGNDVIEVCRSAQCSGIDVRSGGCGAASAADWACPFYFTISLSQEAAQRQAEATKNLAVIEGYLSEKLYLYLDDELVDQLNIGESLKGEPAVSIQISGSGFATTENTATKAAIQEMKKLQTILITGSLPVKLTVERADSISPILGKGFVKNALLTALIATGAVTIILLIAYRKLAVAIPIMITSLTEVYLMLGAAAIIGWNIDLAAIAGIIAAVGTGVNDQIIITDEALKGGARKLYSWKEKIKSAFSVIFGAYFTNLFAMLPLFVIGAGMLRGFALTTIIGMTVGVFITRPAYAKIVEILTEEK
ncbi:PDZ domain-containing protein [Candidatus Woesearchaeota archaeon]|nr:PDZ domain-containing protein [Candidatus Woesearchaeota archaeon]